MNSDESPAFFLNDGRGFSLNDLKNRFTIFNAPPEMVAAFLAQCAAQAVPVQVITLSKTGDELRITNYEGPAGAEVDPVVIYQDLPIQAFERHVETVVEKLIFPLWFSGRPLCFFSQPPEEAYRQKGFAWQAIHDDFPAVARFLLREQMLNLLSSPPDARNDLENRFTSLYEVDPDLDAGQQQARQHLRGPIRVLAPAGSGKTKTLTNRIVHLLNSGIPAGTILALAFNRKAAEEMNQRLGQKGIQDVEVRTFHSLGYQIVRQKLGWRFEGEARPKTRKLLQVAVAEHVQLPRRRGVDSLDPFLRALRRVKTELLPLSELHIEVEEQTIPFAPIFDTYLKLQQRHPVLNFDDMVYLAVRLLLQDDDLRRAYQQQFEYVLVDEFQDLNKSQLLMLQILTLPQNSVFVVGDDDQMIYGWRGAEIRHILDFTHRFPMAADVVLTTNYRSSRDIVRHSRWLIDHNRERVGKDIRPHPEAQSGLVQVEPGANLWEQATGAAAWIEQKRFEKSLYGKKQRHYQWRDFAILGRYNAYQFPLALALDALEIPHSTVNLGEIFQTPVGRDIDAYLSLILQPQEATAEQLQRILKRPNKYFTNQLIAGIGNWNALCQAAGQAGLRPWEVERLGDLTAGLQSLQEYAGRPATTPYLLLMQLELAFGLHAFYREQSRQAAELDEAGDDLLLTVILAISLYFRDVGRFFQFIRETMEGDVAVAESEYGSPRDEVTLSTIHRAKGKEWPNVIYFNLSGNVSNEDDVEEERRVAYVAVTRAQDNLLITTQKGRPSPFLRELMSNPEFAHLSLAQLKKERQSEQRRLGRLQEQLDLQQRRLAAIYDKYPHLATGPPRPGDISHQHVSSSSWQSGLRGLLSNLQVKRLQPERAADLVTKIEAKITELLQAADAATAKVKDIDAEISGREKLS